MRSGVSPVQPCGGCWPRTPEGFVPTLRRYSVFAWNLECCTLRQRPYRAQLPIGGSTLAISHDFSDLPQALYRFALDQLTWQGVILSDPQTDELHQAPNADQLRVKLLGGDPYAYWAWWLRFGVGFETLLKAVFLRHEISLLTKRDVAQKVPGGPKAPSTPAAANVYNTVKTVAIKATNNHWLASELQRLGISHPLELNTGTMGKYREHLGDLVQKGVITQAEEQMLKDSLMVFADIRRNVDAHVFLKSQTGGSINNDLTAVYIPACNTLLKAFR